MRGGGGGALQMVGGGGVLIDGCSAEPMQLAALGSAQKLMRANLSRARLESKALAQNLRGVSVSGEFHLRPERQNGQDPERQNRGRAKVSQYHCHRSWVTILTYTTIVQAWLRLGHACTSCHVLDPATPTHHNHTLQS